MKTSNADLATGQNRRRALHLLAAGLTGSFLLAACQNTAPPQVVFTSPEGGPVPLAVAAIDIISEYSGPGEKPYIDHLFTPSPSDLLVEWAGSRLTPSDGSGNLLFTITCAAMTEINLESEESLKALITNEQSRLVRVELEGIFSFSHPSANRSATLVVRAEYESSIADDTTPAEADQLRLKIARNTVNLFEREFRKQLDNVAGHNGWPKG
ncbi:hypothetical protein AB8880_11450 [Alphaproteobacteria bacterium LSUCC0684]